MPYKSSHYNIDIGSMLWLPATVYWKNKEGYYLGCNDMQLELMNLVSDKDFVDKTLFDLCDAQNAKELSKNDAQVLQSGSTQIIFEYYSSKEKILYPYLSVKTPLNNSNNKTVGLFGFSFSLANTNIALIKPLLSFNRQQNSFFENNIRNYFSRIFNVELSKRQADCLYYLAFGMSIKMIAKKLKLSPRTVEDYLDTAKDKLNCTNKAELICKVIECSHVDVLKNLEITN